MTQSLQDLERDIEQSRARLDMTIDRLQGKMNASGIVDDLLGTARTGRYAPLYDNTLDAIRRNPIPIMLIAMGIGLLAQRLGRSTELARRREQRLAEREPMADDDWANEVEDMRLRRTEADMSTSQTRPASSSAAA